MTRRDELIKLRDAVQAGIWPDDTQVIGSYCYEAQGYLMRAFDGSLDAAKALHETVLPGWTWKVFAWTDCDYVAVLDGPEFSTPEIEVPHIPARAWLLAILEALIAQESDPAPMTPVIERGEHEI